MKHRKLIVIVSFLVLITFLWPAAAAVGDGITLPPRAGVIPLPLGGPAGNWDVTYYGLYLTVDPVAETIDGHTVVHAEATTGGVSGIDLHLVDLSVTQVLEDGAARPWSHDAGLLSVTLSRPYAAGETVEVDVHYGGSPTAGVHFVAARNLVFTYGWDSYARNWFPCIDHPSDKADTTDIEITVPSGMIVASNGLLQRRESSRGGWETFLWHHGYPVTTYNICFHASDYAQFTQYLGPLPIDYYVYPEDLEDAQASFQNIPQMMAHFESVFGPYPFPGEKMGFAEAQLGGGMEHQTMVTIGSAFITGTTFWETLYAHEAAHMWWGDCVAIATWADFWLSEGFASYGDALWQEGGYGEEAFRNRMRVFRNRYFAEDASNRFPIYDPAVMLSSTVYEKGAWIVHMLRRVFDDDPAFFTMLQDYRSAYEHGNVTTAQFQAAAAGLGESLDWFFDQWVYMAGYPEYEYNWSHSAGTVTLQVDQVQPVVGVTPLFSAPVDVRFLTPAGDVEVALLVDEESETFQIEVPARPVAMEFDPDLWLLCKAEMAGGQADLIVAAPGPDQANRCIAALFDIDGNAAGPEIVPYGVDAWGANVACGDLDGDGLLEVLTGPGPGAVFGPHVRGFDVQGSAVPGVSFLAYGTPRWGVNVAAGDIDGDGVDEIVTGAGPGAVFGPHVRGWNVDGGPAAPMSGVSYFAYGTLRWGVNVACGDIDGDDFDEIVTGAGPGAVFGPHVRGWNVDGGPAVPMPGVSFMAYGTPKYGVNVACGDIDGDGIDEMVTGAGPGQVFSSHVRAFDHDGEAGVTPIPGISFFAFNAEGYRYGVQVGLADLDGDGAAEILTAPGPDSEAPGQVRVFSWTAEGTLGELGGFTAFPGAVRGAIVAGGWFGTGR